MKSGDVINIDAEEEANPLDGVKSRAGRITMIGIPLRG